MTLELYIGHGVGLTDAFKIFLLYLVGFFFQRKSLKIPLMSYLKAESLDILIVQSYCSE